MKLAAIAAVAETGVIGRENRLPWHLPRDLAFFKQTTKGHCVISGRRTHESHGVLPGRRNLVLSRRANYQAPGAEVFPSLEAALEAATETESERAFILGGEDVFREALAKNLLDELILTRVHAQYDGDVHFPAFDPEAWALTWQHHHPADEKNAKAMTFEHWARKR